MQVGVNGTRNEGRTVGRKEAVNERKECKQRINLSKWYG